MKKKKINIGSRNSKLALIYAEIAKQKIIENTDFKENDILIKKITTKGDQILNKRLSDLGGKGLFSKNIENELIKGEIDIAVHALKDLPALETDGLKIEAFIERNDPREILITKDKKKLADLKSDSLVGTSSYRREFQIKKIRKDLKCELIRGNVDTRLQKLKQGLYDAIILSNAGIKALCLDKEVSEIFSIDRILPSAGQGIIALQCREDDIRTLLILKNINHLETFYRAVAERNVLKVLEGDCETPVGAHATIIGNKLTLKAELFSLDGSQRFFEKKTSKVENFQLIGKEIGHLLKLKSKKLYKK